jgi:hypothetical protein
VTDLQIVCTSETLLVDISLLARLLVALTSRMERLCLSGVITWQGLDNPAARRELERALGNNAPHLNEWVLNFHVPSALAVVILQTLHPHPSQPRQRYNTTLKSLALYEIRLNGNVRDDDLQHIMTSIAAIEGLKKLSLFSSRCLPWMVLLENGLLRPAMYKNASLVKMGKLEETRYPQKYALDIAKINMMCRVNALLAPQRPTGNDVLIGPLLCPKSGIWSKAIAHLGRRDEHRIKTTTTTTTTIGIADTLWCPANQ